MNPSIKCLMGDFCDDVIFQTSRDTFSFFSCWISELLTKPVPLPSQCDPPLQVQDLFQDIQDGHVLMALLEELSGCRLVRLLTSVNLCFSR